MKKFLGTLMWAFVTVYAFSQPAKSLVQGSVTESSSNNPVSGAVVSLGSRQTVTDETGNSCSAIPQPELMNCR
jgi:iron complex outermembrane receptor protein